jgi:quercetin dioxygenase-like cupin family protein
MAMSNSSALPDCDHSPTGVDGVTWNIMGQVYTPKHLDDQKFVWHATFPEESFVPPHTHPDQDEYLSPFDGEIEVVIGGQRSIVRTGEIGKLPKGIAHAFYNNSGKVVHALFWAEPAGELLALYRRIHNVASPRRVTEIAPDYGVVFEPPISSAR